MKAEEFIEKLGDLAEVDEVDRVIRVGIEGLTRIVVRMPEAVDPVTDRDLIKSGLLGYVDPDGER